MILFQISEHLSSSSRAISERERSPLLWLERSGKVSGSSLGATANANYQQQRNQRRASEDRLRGPENLRVTRRVGSDSLLLAWTPPDDDGVTGYQVRGLNSSQDDQFIVFLFTRFMWTTAPSRRSGACPGPRPWSTGCRSTRPSASASRAWAMATRGAARR